MNDVKPMAFVVFAAENEEISDQLCLVLETIFGVLRTNPKRRYLQGRIYCLLMNMVKEWRKEGSHFSPNVKRI